jgi:hypothetical protein
MVSQLMQSMLIHYCGCSVRLIYTDYVGLLTASCMGAIWRFRKAQLMGPPRSLTALKRPTKGKETPRLSEYISFFLSMSFVLYDTVGFVFFGVVIW